jgi:beta-galactosidase/beta-glucuronidase
LIGFLQADNSWAEAGHILVTQQFPLKFIFANPIPAKVSEPERLTGQVGWRIYNAKVLVECSKNEDTIKVLTLDPKTGGVESYYSPKGNNMLQDALLPNFVRAATDNDKGGLEQPIDFLFPGANYEILFGILHNIDEFSYWSRWKYIGLSASAPPQIECVDLRMRRLADQHQVLARAICHVINPKHKTTLFDVQIDYHIWGDGRVRVHYTVEPTAVVRPVSSLPRVGAHLALLPTYANITYFGRGPHENYPDRKTSANLGVYNTTPYSMGYSKYIVPGENGSRSDCQWISFRHDEDGHGLLVCAEAGKTFSCSALPYSIQELEKAKHTYDLPIETDAIHINIDHRLMGLGGDTR